MAELLLWLMLLWVVLAVLFVAGFAWFFSRLNKRLPQMVDDDRTTNAPT